MTDFQSDRPSTLARYDAFKSNHGAKLLLFSDLCKKNRHKVKNDNFDLSKSGKSP